MSDTVDAAPAALARLVEFVNTRRADGDAIGTPEQLTIWLRTHELLPEGSADTAAQQRTARVREGLRALLATNNAEPVTSPRPDGLNPAARTELAALTAALPLTLDVTSTPPRLVPHTNDGVDHALATLLADVATAVASGTWSRLKTCREPSCRWAFYDHSRNRGRTWCSMDVCGNRVKVRASHRRNAAR
ncbi:CGNR zinc finger domain-containing protein [Nocardia vinacea]|uniref:CGNR zinc finger domain-containing protein n=1 Tax=Nocardia vinacea TaxID=96468 RepID=UPI000315A6DC|nr:CGNR zinc finger domain-containing protein [Nocardia vinacea]